MRPGGRRLEGRRPGGRAARRTAARQGAARRLRLGEMTPMTVSSYDNVKPLKTGATAIRRWGRAVVGREGVEGRLHNVLNKIYT